MRSFELFAFHIKTLLHGRPDSPELLAPPGIMDQRKEGSVRDLPSVFKKIERLLRQDQDIQITKRGRVIARLLPENPDRKASKLPDFLSRMRAEYAARTPEVSGADLISQDRSRY